MNGRLSDKKELMDPRELTDIEREITRWLIEHGTCSGEDKKIYAAQLSEVMVAGVCGCGCASVDFAIPGELADRGGGLEILGDFITKDRRFGIFVFAKNQKLGGVEIWSVQGDETGAVFPATDELMLI